MESQTPQADLDFELLQLRLPQPLWRQWYTPLHEFRFDILSLHEEFPFKTKSLFQRGKLRCPISSLHREFGHLRLEAAQWPRKSVGQVAADDIRRGVRLEADD